MPESPDEPLSPRKKWIEGHSGIVNFLETIGAIAFIAIVFFIMYQFPHDPKLVTHENCEVKGINVTSSKGWVYTDIYASGCTNSQHEIEYFAGPVYKGIQEYEKAKDEKSDNYIQLHKTYTFTNQVYNTLGQDHEYIKDFTLVK